MTASIEKCIMLAEQQGWLSTAGQAREDLRILNDKVDYAYELHNQVKEHQRRLHELVTLFQKWAMHTLTDDQFADELANLLVKGGDDGGHLQDNRTNQGGLPQQHDD